MGVCSHVIITWAELLNVAVYRLLKLRSDKGETTLQACLTGQRTWRRGGCLPRALQALLLGLITSDYKGQRLRDNELSGWISCIPAMFKIPVMLSSHRGQRLQDLIFNMAGEETNCSCFVFVFWDAQELVMTMISHLFPSDSCSVFPSFGSRWSRGTSSWHLSLVKFTWMYKFGSDAHLQTWKLRAVLPL